MKRYYLFLLFLLGTTAQDQESWKTLSPSGTASPRHESSFVAVGDKLYALGGRGIRPVEEYDTQSNTWVKVADAPLEIHHFQAVAYQDEVWIVGAMTGNYPHETPLPTVLIFNPKTRTWREGPALPENRKRGSAGVVVHKNKLYLVCGIQDGHFDGFVRWFDEYDPKTGTWKTLPNAPRARDHVSAAVVSGKLYLAGGRTSYAKIGKVLELTHKEVDVFDFASQTWSTLDAELPSPRAGNSNLGIGPYLVVMNGESSAQQTAHAEVEVLDTRTGLWSQLPMLNQGRHGTGTVFLNGKIWVHAGSANRGGGPEVSSMEVLDWKK